MRALASRMSVMSGEGALTIFAQAKELERSGRSIIHLELGEPDFHPAKSVNDALKRAIDDGKDRYCPVIGVPALREALAAYLRDTRSLNVSAQNIVIAPGCKIALFMAMMALIDPGDEVLYPDPGFPGYASITLGLGGIPVPFVLSDRNQLQPDPQEIAAKITPRTKVLITNSPGNPTGTVYTDEVQRQLAELAVKHDLLVLSDEIYARIIYGGTYLSMMNYPGMEERTVIIDGFSKSFAMTGWRLGYAVAPPRIVPALDLLAVNTYTCVAEFSQYGAIEALRDRDDRVPRLDRTRTRDARPHSRQYGVPPPLARPIRAPPPRRPARRPHAIQLVFPDRLRRASHGHSVAAVALRCGDRRADYAGGPTRAASWVESYLLADERADTSLPSWSVRQAASSDPNRCSAAHWFRAIRLRRARSM